MALLQLGVKDDSDATTLTNLRSYAIEQSGEGIQWTRVPANPFAATVNSSGPYDRVDLWNEYVWEDWQAGVGHVDPEAGGFLFAEAETRVPGQVILPPLVQQSDARVLDNTSADCRYMPTSIAGTVTVGSGGHARVAARITTPSTLPLGDTAISFYARVPAGVSVTIAVYTNSSGAPGTSVTSTTFTGDSPDPMFYWYGGAMILSGLNASTAYWLVIYPTTSTDTMEIAYGSSDYNVAAQRYNGSSWAALTSTYLIYTTGLYRLSGVLAEGRGAGFVRFNGALYTHKGEDLHKFDATDDNFDSVGTINGSGDVTSMVVFGPNIYFGRSSGNYATMSTSESFSAGSVGGKLFLSFKGLLYRAHENDLYYTANGSTWTGPFAAGGDDVEIRGMAGLGDSVYCATDKALMRFAPGNVMEEVTRFGAEDTTNGFGMIEYQGALYIPVGGRIFRMDASGQLQDIWISREDDLPATRIGRVVHLSRMNNWLVAFVVPLTDGTRPSLWMWQSEGWHFLAGVPQTKSHLSDLYYQTYYDRGTARLWFTAGNIAPLHLDIDDFTINPYNVGDYLYMPHGWIEQDRYYGGKLLIDKSWESITVTGDNLSSTTPVDVYYQDEDSTGWELLGTATEDGQELRWDTPSTRPEGKWVKLALRLRTTDGDETPRVRAVTAKFFPFPNRYIRDTVVITLKDYIELTGGTKSTYTMAQQKTHIETLIDSRLPIVVRDPYGVYTESWIRDWSMAASKYDVAGNVTEMRCTLVLEEIATSTLNSS